MYIYYSFIYMYIKWNISLDKVRVFHHPKSYGGSQTLLSINILIKPRMQFSLSYWIFRFREIILSEFVDTILGHIHFDNFFTNVLYLCLKISWPSHFATYFILGIDLSAIDSYVFPFGMRWQTVFSTTLYMIVYHQNLNRERYIRSLYTHLCHTNTPPSPTGTLIGDKSLSTMWPLSKRVRFKRFNYFLCS